MNHHPRVSGNPRELWGPSADAAPWGKWGLGRDGPRWPAGTPGQMGLTGTPGRMGSHGGSEDARTNRTPCPSQGQVGTSEGCARGTRDSAREKQEPPGCVGPWVLGAASPHFTHWERTFHACWARGLLGACSHWPAVTGVVPLAQSSLSPHCISPWFPSLLVPLCWHRQVHAHPGSSLW